MTCSGPLVALARGAVLARCATGELQFEIRAVGGTKGLGAVAREALAAGQRVLCEAPLLVVPSSGGAAPQTEADIKELLRRRSPPERESFWTLGDAHAAVGCASSAEGIVKTNGLPIDGDVGIFPHASRFNHSCRPNAHNSWHEDVSKEVIHVIRDVAAGEELCITYLGENLYAPRAARQAQLLERFNFRCGCAACSLEDAEVEASDQRRLRLRRLHDALTAEDGGSRAGASQGNAVKEMARLIDEELGSHPGLKCRAFSLGFEHAAQEGEIDEALYMVQAALANMELAEGPRSPRSLLLRGCVDMCS